jgi:2-polyprenyl-6-methoxyphenol hydroxylase-like FAD-dependent oxidoreductase
MGQGANQSIEDAIVLAELLNQNRHNNGNGIIVNYENAFQQYYEKRWKRTYRIVELANFLNKLYHSRNPLLSRFLDWFMKNLASGGFVFKQIEKEILEECPVNYRDFV